MPDYDICIIGGGIQGCGVAQAAAAAGYRALLLEQTALASATSSRSSKLVHGGLRYLESAQFSLVAESLRERELLVRNAPELVRRVAFYLPVYKHTARRPWQIRLGLSLYALLGRLRATACFKRLERAQWHDLGGLNTRNLQAVYQFWDAQTDDRELTRAVMYSASQLGATLFCPARFDAAQRTTDGYAVTYIHDGAAQTVSCSALVNAAGPWINRVQACITPSITMPPIELVAGAHIVLDHPAPRGVFYVESPGDRRAIFIMPWRGQTLIGTTETAFSGDPAHVEAGEHEVAYLCAIARHYFPAIHDTVVQKFAGVRVLPEGDKRIFTRSRDALYITDRALPGYVALAGGKLTTYRAVAHKTLDLIQPELPRATARADTRHIRLVPAPANFEKKI